MAARSLSEDFNEAIKASAFLKNAGGYAIAEYAASKVPDAGAPSAFQKALAQVVHTFNAYSLGFAIHFAIPWPGSEVSAVELVNRCKAS